jgi:hypothetical protein
MIEDGKLSPRKQRHTVKRIFDLPRFDHSYTSG